jgi:hypothetical protein
LIERLVCSAPAESPPDSIERAVVVAIEAMDAMAVVEFERFGSRRNPQPVVGMAACRAAVADKACEPVQNVAPQAEAVRSAWSEEARGCEAVSGLRAGARPDRSSELEGRALRAAGILRWRSDIQYHWGNTENRWGIVVDTLDRFSFQPHLWWRILIFAPIKIKITPCGRLHAERLPPTFLRDDSRKVQSIPTFAPNACGAE